MQNNLVAALNKDVQSDRMNAVIMSSLDRIICLLTNETNQI